MKYFGFIAFVAALASGCASTSQVGAPATAQGEAREACGSFFVYSMCMIDQAGDHRVDYMYFADDHTIFMYQPGTTLPANMPLHRCARPMSEDVVAHSSRLLYGDDLNLLEEMDVKRKLLVSYMAAKGDVDECYGADSSGESSGVGAEEEFASDDYDWGED
jgi:hypothetical protein